MWLFQIVTLGLFDSYKSWPLRNFVAEGEACVLCGDARLSSATGGLCKYISSKIGVINHAALAHANARGQIREGRVEGGLSQGRSVDGDVKRSVNCNCRQVGGRQRQPLGSWEQLNAVEKGDQV